MVTTFNGDVPGIRRGVQQDFKRLFFSERDIALILEKNFRPGYGVIEMGMVCGVCLTDSALVPNPKATIDVDDPAIAVAVSNIAAEASTIVVDVEDSYKFKVGDSLILRCLDSTLKYHDGGAITGISRGSRTATITFTTALGETDSHFTTANSTNCYIKTYASSPYKKAVYIADGSKETGTGSDALGANGSVVISNAMLYKGELVNYDSTAATDLGAVEDGQFVILK